mgnify:CR=1 FL=1
MGNIHIITYNTILSLRYHTNKNNYHFPLGSQAAQINAKLEFLPTSIEHEKTQKTANTCYGVSWTEDDRIICAMNKKIEIRQAGSGLQLDQTNVLPKCHNIHSALVVGCSLFTKCMYSKEKKYMTYSGSLDEPTVLHSEKHERPNDLTHISANKEYMASLDIVNKTLNVFSTINNEHLFDIQLTGMERPYGVHLTSDGVLVTDFIGGKLSKYSMSSSYEPLWT